MWCVQQYCRGGRFRLRHAAADVAAECFPDKKSAKAYMKQFEPFSKSCKHKLVRCGSIDPVTGACAKKALGSPRRRRRR
jgi:hypothetical protein